MLFSKCSLLTGVEASAAQNLPVTKTCSQCGAVLLSTVPACNFCDSSFSVDTSSWEEPSDVSAKEKLATNADPRLTALGGEGSRQVPLSLSFPSVTLPARRRRILRLQLRNLLDPSMKIFPLPSRSAFLQRSVLSNNQGW